MRALHRTLCYLLVGGILFAARQLWLAPPAHDIALESAQLESLKAAATRRLGRAPDAAEYGELVRQLADREVLVAEALAQGLDRGDLLVRRRLLQNMRFIAQDREAAAELLERAYRLDMPRRDPVVRQRLVHLMQMRLAGAASEPGAAEVDALARREADALARPARVRFHHIFAGGDRAEERLRALAQRQPAPADAARLSDPLLLAAQIGPAHEAGIARDFGPSFAAAVMRLPAGQWSAPVRSAYGAHLVWVERHWPAVAADPDYARERARLALRATSQEQAQTEATRALRSRYRVRHGSGGEP